MLILAKKLHELAFGKLMEIYVEGNLENGQQAAPEEPVAQQIAIGEQNFYQYLNQVFFPTPEAVYAVWEENGQYISALRLETYRDGMLLEALETRPDYRRRGYAKKLIDAVLPYYPGLKIYSHVSRKNTASLRTHERCGFQRVLDYAVYADGSVLRHMDTLCITVPQNAVAKETMI